MKEASGGPAGGPAFEKLDKQAFMSKSAISFRGAFALSGFATGDRLLPNHEQIL
jgi:hypothetical protein